MQTNKLQTLIVHQNVRDEELSKMLENDFKLREAHNINAHYIVPGSSTVAFYVVSDYEIMYQ
jgi:hypothetical protein